jgi:hypothetical protein
VVAACTPLGTCSDRQFTVPEVTNQLQKARQYTTGNRFSLYDQGLMLQMAPFASAMQFASA